MQELVSSKFINNIKYRDWTRVEYQFPNGYGAFVECNHFTDGIELTVIKKVSSWQWVADYTTPVASETLRNVRSIDFYLNQIQSL